MKNTLDSGRVIFLGLLFAVSGGLGLAAGSWSLLHWGAPAAEVMAAHNGEVLMRRAMIYEEAGEYALARENYQAALAGNFVGEQNRAYSQKGLALAELALGNEDAARDLFEALLKTPHWSVAWYKAYVPLLRGEERQAQVEQWYRAAENGGHSEERWLALEAMAQGYEASGDREAAREVFATLAAERPQSEAAFHLGRLELARGERQRARNLMAQYLAGGGAATAFGEAALAHLRELEAVTTAPPE